MDTHFHNPRRYKVVLVLLLLVFVFATASIAMGHVTIKPAQVGVGSFQTFSVGVPVERDIPTIGIRLVIPEGLEHVTPNVKPGWRIEVKKTGEGETSKVTEIVWTGGSIPQGQRDDFLFSAKAPAQETTLKWMAYQTYRDGTIVAWAIDPRNQPKKADGTEDFATSGPYSETRIINDLQAGSAPSQKATDRNWLPLTLSLIAVAVSIVALLNSKRKVL